MHQRKYFFICFKKVHLSFLNLQIHCDFSHRRFVSRAPYRNIHNYKWRKLWILCSQNRKRLFILRLEDMRTNVSEARKVGVLDVFMEREDMTFTWNSILRLWKRVSSPHRYLSEIFSKRNKNICPEKNQYPKMNRYHNFDA